MAKLLTDSDFQSIRTAINDTVETFAQLPVTYHKRAKAVVNRFNRDNHETDQYTDYELLSLSVWSGEGEATRDEKGKFDISDGYLLFGYDYLDGEGLINADNQVIFEPEKDFVTFEGEKYEVTGVNSLGQLKDVNAVIKVHIRKNLK